MRFEIDPVAFDRIHAALAVKQENFDYK